MRKLIGKIVSSWWFGILCAIAIVYVVSEIRDRYWPQPEPDYETLNIRVDDFDGLSVQAKQTVTGVEFSWDFLRQELVIDNRYNDHPAKVRILGWDAGPTEYKPHERHAFSRWVTIGSKVGVEVEVEESGLHKTKHFIIGQKPEDKPVIGQNQ